MGSFTRIYRSIWFFYFLQLYCSIRISSMGYSGRFPQGKPSVTGSRYPAYGTAGCLSVSILHRTLTWTTESSTCAKTFNACDGTRGCADTERESALKVDSGQKQIPCRTGKMEAASAACRSDTLRTELHPQPRGLERGVTFYRGGLSLGFHCIEVTTSASVATLCAASWMGKSHSGGVRR